MCTTSLPSQSYIDALARPQKTSWYVHPVRAELKSERLPSRYAMDRNGSLDVKQSVLSHNEPFKLTLRHPSTSKQSRS